MSTSDKLKQLMSDLSDELILEKEEEIKRLTALNDKLREENDRLKQQVQYKTSDQSSPNLTRKATELKKALDEFLGQEVSNRRQMPYIPPSISIPSDVNKSSTISENSKPYRSNPDDTLMNGTIHNHHGIHNFEPNHDSTFSTQQNFREVTDTDIVNAATEIRQSLPYHNQPNHNAHNGHHSYVPGLNINGRRFNNNNNIGGLNNNNNNRNRHNNNHNNNNNNNNNNSNSSSKYTIFIAWSGTSTADQVRELFDPSDVVDVRYTPPKQFAHVDLKTENAVNKAMALHGTTKTEAQGSLRVETGKPRSSNTAENGQRQQNQIRTYNNNRQNNKNPNGFNNGGLPPKKYNNPNYNHNNRNNNNNNNHSGQYQNFGPAVEKENGTNGTTLEWQTFATTSVSNQEPKQNES